VSAVSFILTVILYTYAFQADIFVSSDYTAWDPECGYTAAQFVEFLFATFLFPYAIVFLLLFMSHSYKNMPHDRWYKLALYVLLFVLSVVALAVSAVNSKDVLGCLGMFCTVDSGVSLGRPPNNGNGAIIGMNLIFFFVALFFLLLLGVLVGLVALFRARGVPTAFAHETPATERTPLIVPSSVDVDKLRSVNAVARSPPPPVLDVTRVRKYVSHHLKIDRNTALEETAFITLMFVAFFPLIIVACTLLPDWIFYFTKYDIQKFQALRPSPDLDIYFDAVAEGNPIQPKLYLDILVFYAAIYLAVGVALLAMVSGSVRRVLNMRLSTHISLGQALLAAVFAALLAGEFCYWFLVHGYQGEARETRSNAELAARALGQLNNVILGIHLLPVVKNGVWSAVFGVSWEAMMIYHQITGYLFLLSIAAHMFAWWYVYHEQNSFPGDILAVPMVYHSDNFTIPAITITFFVMIVVFGVLTHYTIRRSNYELFYYAHFFSGVVFLMVLWHATMSWYYILPGLALYAVDHGVRLMRNVAAGVVLADFSVALVDTAEPHADLRVHAKTDKGDAARLVNDTHVLRGEAGVVKIAYTIKAPVHTGTVNTPLAHSMGQYCYLNVPRISRLEWHPFSISSAPVDTLTTHHIKVMGDYDPALAPADQQQWTAKLYGLALELQRLRSLPRDRALEPEPPADAPRVPIRGDEGGTLREALLNAKRQDGAGPNSSSSAAAKPPGTASDAGNGGPWDLPGSGSSSSTSWARDGAPGGGMRSIAEVMADEQIVVNVEGPYGLSVCDCLNRNGYTHLLFIAGGIGVTPLHSCLRQLYVTAKACRFSPTKPEPPDAAPPASAGKPDKKGGETKAPGNGGEEGEDVDDEEFHFDFDAARRAMEERDAARGDYHPDDLAPTDELPAYPYPLLQSVKLVWAIKTPSQAGENNMFADTFDLISADNVKGMFEVAVHITGHDKVKEQADALGLGNVITSKKKQYGENKGILIKIGRPELEEEVKRVAPFAHKALLFVCGPAALVEDCAKLTKQYGIDFRHETFEL
jgi:hypothetical protein